MRIFTIGFAGKSAEEFFSLLERAGVRRVVDIRLHNVSQLAGFTKRDDLAWFLQKILGIGYVHREDLAPTEEILGGFRKKGGDRAKYEVDFKKLLAKRKVGRTVPKELMDGACLLCSESVPEKCHRRLVAEHLKKAWGEVEIVHL